MRSEPAADPAERELPKLAKESAASILPLIALGLRMGVGEDPLQTLQSYSDLFLFLFLDP
jgi:hypothetical protein